MNSQLTRQNFHLARIQTCQTALIRFTKRRLHKCQHVLRFFGETHLVDGGFDLIARLRRGNIKWSYAKLIPTSTNPDVIWGDGFNAQLVNALQLFV